MIEARSVNAGPLKLRISQEGGASIVRLSGELDLANAGVVERELQLALADGNGRVVLDLGDLTFIDSTGIALIVRAWQRVDAAAGNGGEGGLVLCCQNEQVRRVLEVTGLEHSLRVVATRDEAIAALRG